MKFYMILFATALILGGVGVLYIDTKPKFANDAFLACDLILIGLFSKLLWWWLS